MRLRVRLSALITCSASNTLIRPLLRVTVLPAKSTGAPTFTPPVPPIAPIVIEVAPEFCILSISSSARLKVPVEPSPKPIVEVRREGFTINAPVTVNVGTRSRFVSVFAVKVTSSPEKLFAVKVSALLPLSIATSWPAALNTPFTESTPVFVNWNPPFVEVIAPRLLIRLALFKVVVLAVLFTARVPAVMVVTPS